MYVWAYLYVVLGFRCWVPTHFEITHQMPYSISKPTLISVFFAVGSSHIRYLFFVRPSPALNPTSDNYICSRLCCSTVWENILRLTKKSMGWKSQTAQAYKFSLVSDVGFGLDRAFHEFVCIFFQRNPKSKWRTYREQHSSQKRNIVLNWFILCAFETCVCTSATLSGLCLLSVYQDVSRNKWVSRVCYVIKQMTIMLRTKIQDNRIKSQKLRGKKGNYAFLELLLLFLFVMRYSSSSNSKLHFPRSYSVRLFVWLCTRSDFAVVCSNWLDDLRLQLSNTKFCWLIDYLAAHFWRKHPTQRFPMGITVFSVHRIVREYVWCQCICARFLCSFSLSATHFEFQPSGQEIYGYHTYIHTCNSHKYTEY